MKDRRLVLAEKNFDLVEMGFGYFLENAESEGLCQGRFHAVEHRVSARDLDPLGAAFRLDPGPRDNKIGICARLGALEFLGDSFIAKNCHNRPILYVFKLSLGAKIN